MSLEVYEQARKIGLRCVKTRAAQGLDPYLPALEDDKLKILKTQELPVTAIPLDCVTGTRTRGRTNSFAADFMPLLEPASEFAGSTAGGRHPGADPVRRIPRTFLCPGRKQAGLGPEIPEGA